MADSPDVFDQLFEFKWRGVSAPCRSFKTTGGQANAEHGRVDRDGARIETTGRNPYTFTASLAFINGLTPGTQETWGAGLFPGQFKQFVAAMEDRSTGDLQHPLFGVIKCKPISWDFALEAENRGGVYVEAVFKETTEDDAAVALGSLDAFTLASVAAGDLDSAMGSINPSIDLGAAFKDGGFSGLVDSLSSVASPFEKAASSVVGKIGAAVQAVDAIADFFSNDAPKTTSGQNLKTQGGGLTASGLNQTQSTGQALTVTNDDGTTSPLGNSSARIIDACNRLREGLVMMQADLFVADKAIAFYTVPQTTTLGALSAQLGNDVSDLIELNGALLGSPFVPAESVVRYYAA